MGKEKTWHIENYIGRLLPDRGSLVEAFPSRPAIDLREIDVTLELLEECYIFMAHIVKSYGEHYLPIFERLHSEIETRKHQNKMLDTALTISAKNPVI
ncbi:MAG: hypothetical protein JKY88_04605 [Pseudomonadales bacterium]|nr:hypothetical protein [Pseudomonadales bacterium]